MIRILFLLPFCFLLKASIAQSKQELVKANTQFAFDIYQQFSKSQPNQNIFFSPYSISATMAAIYAGAANNTEKQMQQVLKFSPLQSDVLSGFAELKSNLKQNTDSITLSIANSLWVQSNYVFNTDYLSLINEKYECPVYSVNFTKPKTQKQAISEINTWVEKNTNNQVHNFIKPDDVTSETRLILVNSILFYGEWQYYFNENATAVGTFYSSKGEQNTNFMSQKGKYLYYDDDMLTALQIPYKGNKISMLIMLPVSLDGISALEKNLDTQYLDAIMRDMSEVSLKLVIPKFSFDYSIDLKNTFQCLGMVDAFSDEADFSKITQTNDLKIDKILHKAKIEINEKGSKAAAVTSVTMMRKTAVIDEPVFNANHPFIYLIRDNETGSILFLGKMVSIL